MGNGDLLIADGTGSLTEIKPSGKVVRKNRCLNRLRRLRHRQMGLIFVGRPDGFAQIRDTGEEISLVEGQRVNSIEILPSGNLLIACSRTMILLKKLCRMGR